MLRAFKRSHRIPPNSGRDLPGSESGLLQLKTRASIGPDGIENEATRQNGSHPSRIFASAKRTHLEIAKPRIRF